MKPAATRSRTPEPPYCWQSKEALRQIERTYDSESSTRLACAAYLALTRIASDKQAESFECSVKEIANYMHYRYDQTLKGIQLAEAAGVIKVERRKVAGTAENAPSIYTLLGVIEKIDKVIDSPRFAVNPESIEITEKEQRKNREVTHPQTPHDCVECVCDSHPGGNGSEEGNTPLAAKPDRKSVRRFLNGRVAANWELTASAVRICSAIAGANAAEFHDLAASAFTEIGAVEREVRVADRGDGKVGRVDLVIHDPEGDIGVELDRQSPRQKSIVKLERNFRRWMILLREPIEPAFGGSPSCADDGGFAEFWKVYPRKVGKLAAERAWKRHRPPLSEVLAALEAWRNSPEWLKDGGRYIPHPATWVNRGGWEDELPAVRQQPDSFI